MEIEKKFLINMDKCPYDLTYAKVLEIEQAYLCTEPVVRIRKENDNYYLTYKSKGNMPDVTWMLAHEEYNLPLTKEAYLHLRNKVDGNIITKKRYLLPLDNSLTVELDVFEGKFDGLILAEIEFPDIDTANAFEPLDWFTTEVTYDTAYFNSVMSKKDMS